MKYLCHNKRLILMPLYKSHLRSKSFQTEKWLYLQIFADYFAMV